MRPRVELVATGTELLRGRTLNRHALLLGERLPALGFDLARVTMVPDRVADIQEALRSALDRVDIVLVTGGLGPTADDVTPEAIADWMGRPVVTDPVALDSLRRRYERLGRAVTPAAERQARVVEGAVALPNPVGVAPGERLELGRKTIFVLPGPPAEFQALLEKDVLPWLDAAAPRRARLPHREFLVCGLGESDIAARFEQAGFPPKGIEVAYCAGPGRIAIRLDALSDAADWSVAVEKARGLLAGHIFSEAQEDLAQVVGRLLNQMGKNLATAESCTGGLLGARITSVAGSSAWYRGGVIVYANDAKVAELGISMDVLNREGAVSAPVAAGMARAARERFRADVGLGITGIAGPAGGTPEKPVGLVFIGLADNSSCEVRQYRFGGDRPRIREWSVQMALDLLRRRLQGVEDRDAFSRPCSV